MNELIKCTKCGQEKVASEFRIDLKKKNKLRSDCRACERVRQQKIYNKENATYHRNKHLVRKYGITIDDYFAMLEKQGGVCAICGRGPENFELTDKEGRVKSYTRLLVDHDHKTGKIRGLLCRGCNTGLGQFQDSADVMFKAISYLKEERQA